MRFEDVSISVLGLLLQHVVVHVASSDLMEQNGYIKLYYWNINNFYLDYTKIFA